MTTQYVTDGLALIATIVNTAADDAANKVAVAKLSTQILADEASSADVKTLVDALIKQQAAAPVPPGPLPIVSGLSVTTGSATGGDKVVITGTFPAALVVHFGAIAAASFTQDSDTQITVPSTPAQAAGTVNGTVDVTVTTAGGISAIVPADNFKYV